MASASLFTDETNMLIYLADPTAAGSDSFGRLRSGAAAALDEPWSGRCPKPTEVERVTGQTHQQTWSPDTSGSGSSKERHANLKRESFQAASTQDGARDLERMSLNDAQVTGQPHQKVLKNGGGEFRTVESAMLKRMSKTEQKNERMHFNGSNCFQDHSALEVPNNKLRQAFFQQKL